MILTAISIAGQLVQSIGDAKSNHKLASILVSTYGEGTRTAYDGAAISDVPTAIAYCRMKNDRRDAHRLGQVGVSTAAAVSAAVVAGPVGLAIGVGAGTGATYAYRGIKKLWKRFYKGTLGEHRKAAASTLMKAVYSQGVDTGSRDFSAALQALIVIMGTDFVIEVDRKVNGYDNTTGDRSKYSGYVDEVYSALKSW